MDIFLDGHFLWVILHALNRPSMNSHYRPCVGFNGCKGEIMKRTTGILAVAVVAALTAISVRPAAASIIHYANVSAGGVTISNITEINSSSDPTASYYGAPTFNGSTLVFLSPSSPNPASEPFEVAATVSTSADLSAKLEFQVTAAAGLNPSAFLSEFGLFSGVGTGFATVSQYVTITDTNGNQLLDSGGNPAVGLGSNSFVAAPGSATTILSWTGGAGAAAVGTATTFDVIIDNDLVAGAPLPASSAEVEKKGLSITIGQGGTRPPTPEPASLGLLGAGAVALIARRRKA
jgi:PEP-CTERM motif